MSVFAVDAQDFRAETAVGLWATVRAQATGDAFNDGTISHFAYTYTTTAGVTAAIGRAGSPYDTSVLGAGANILSAFQSLFIGDMGDPDVTDTVTCPGSYPLPASAADYSSFAFTNGGRTLNSGLTPGSYHQLPLNATGLTFINKTGFTKLMMVNGRDFDNAAPTDYNYITWNSAEGANPPSLDVTIAAPVGDSGLTYGRRRGRR